jgi:hypothetical protein
MRFVEKNQKPEFFNGEFVDVHEKALFVMLRIVGRDTGEIKTP